MRRLAFPEKLKGPPASELNCPTCGESILLTGGARLTRLTAFRAETLKVKLKRWFVLTAPNGFPRPLAPLKPRPPSPPPSPRPPPPPPRGPFVAVPPLPPSGPNPKVLLRRKFRVNCAGPVP